MVGAYTIRTDKLDMQVYLNCFSEVLLILKANNIMEVELYFSNAWGNEYRNYTPFNITLDLIQNEIDLAEKSGAGHFGHDDLFISVNHLDTEVLFSHESMFCMDYNTENTLVSDIIRMLNAMSILTYKKKNEFPRSNAWRPPDILQNKKWKARLVSKGLWTSLEGFINTAQIFALNYDFYYEYNTMYDYENQQPVLNADGEQYVLWWHDRPFFTQVDERGGLNFPGAVGLTLKEVKEAGKNIARQIIIWKDLPDL
jgi:hypothetical protein